MKNFRSGLCQRSRNTAESLQWFLIALSMTCTSTTIALPTPGRIVQVTVQPETVRFLENCEAEITVLANVRSNGWATISYHWLVNGEGLVSEGSRLLGFDEHGGTEQVRATFITDISNPQNITITFHFDSTMWDEADQLNAGPTTVAVPLTCPQITDSGVGNRP